MNEPSIRLRKMTFEEFQLSTKEDHAPIEIDPLLLALWYDAKGDWVKSHAIVQDIDSKDASMIHAYLHRKERDDWNADYWYQRAGRKRTNDTIEYEWNSLVSRFIS